MFDKITISFDKSYLFHPADTSTEPTHAVPEQVLLYRESRWVPGSASGGAVPQLLCRRESIILLLHFVHTNIDTRAQVPCAMQAIRRFRVAVKFTRYGTSVLTRVMQ